jgi:hypothetical protein
MTTLREAAQQALEALEMLAQPTKTNSETPRYKAHKAAITALCAALAQEEQEEQQNRAQQMRDAGYTRRPTLREMAQQEREDIAQNLQSRLDAALLLEGRRQEIAQPRRETEQEPVAYTTGLIWRPRQSELVLKVTRSKQERYGFTVPLWTSPPRREWRSLSDAEVRSIHGALCNTVGSDYRSVAIAIEAALKEKNNG